MHFKSKQQGRTKSASSKSRHKGSKRFAGLSAAKKRLVFAVGFMVLALPASWLVANAESVPEAVGLSRESVVAGNSDGKDQSGGSVNGQSKVSGNQNGSGQPPKVSPSATEKAKAQAAAKSKQTASPTAKPAAGTAKSPTPVSVPPKSAAASVPPAPATGVHHDIITTIFWAGETADASNAYITNTMSAWDEKWQEHYGGVDDPNNRNGYLPAAFTPLENPFYFALPYNDYDSNGRKASASLCSAVSGVTNPNTSWCKNAWIKIMKGGKTAYAQWQDVGPLGEDDVDYVFGTARPKNTWGAKAGLDVSPAVATYLGLTGIDPTSWAFVSASSVPNGPWKDRVTTSGVYWE